MFLWKENILKIIKLLLILVLMTNRSEAQKTLLFGGYTWEVKHFIDEKVGPGNNYFDEKNVWIDKKGLLHLILKKDKLSNKWTCAEVATKDSLDYGTYQFFVEGKIDKLDKNVVFGLFDYGGLDGFEENDIEFARWGDDKKPNLNYTVYPAKGTDAKSQTFEQEVSFKNSLSLHQFTRKPNEVKFQSFSGFQTYEKEPVSEKSFTETGIILSKSKMPVRINLWLFRGKTPSDEKDIEVIIHDFKFIPSL